MKRSLINPLLIILATLVASVSFSVVQAENWRFFRKPTDLKQQGSQSASVVRAQIGSSGYCTPTLPPSTPSYAQTAPYPTTTAPAYQQAPAYQASSYAPANTTTTANNSANNSGWQPVNATPPSGTRVAANYNSGVYPSPQPTSSSHQNPPTANTTAPNTASSKQSSGYEKSPSSKPYGQEFPWIYGTGPPPTGTGDAAGQGGYLPNWGGPDGGQIFAPNADGSYITPGGYRNPINTIPLLIRATETQTGRLMFGVGVNSDAGLIGNIVLDEQNFDWRRFPRSFGDIRDATAWRGAGQRFRLEAVPGTEVQRYMATFQEPYLLGSRVSLGLSGNYYTRIYRDWTEDRIGGSVQLGYHLTHSLTGSLRFRGARVDVFNIANPAPAELTEVEGRNALYGFQARLAHDTRDSTFMPTEGHLIELGVEQVVGTYKYPKVDLDVRKYFMMHERPDGSGRHVLSLSYRLGWAGDDTPIYDHYFAGGFSTIRGFDYRGASPYDAATGVFVGGQFQMLASAEYLFPITADDMLRGVVFCDTGTVERTINHWDDKYRVAPGFGLRITVPAMGPAPIALDFAFPIVKEDSDWTETFSFFVGLTR